jgi:hypothetical protein
MSLQSDLITQPNIVRIAGYGLLAKIAVAASRLTDKGVDVTQGSQSLALGRNSGRCFAARE